MSEMLLRIHSGHMGIEKCLNRTRHYVLPQNVHRHYKYGFVLPHMPRVSQL